jgi:hypothetical protein
MLWFQTSAPGVLQATTSSTGAGEMGQKCEGLTNKVVIKRDELPPFLYALFVAQ